MSAVPPVIPPLDLRPNFQTAVSSSSSSGISSAAVPAAPPIPAAPVIVVPVLAQPTPRKSRLPQPTLPTVAGSPRVPNMVSVIYEDSSSVITRTSSFITAPSPVSPSTPAAAADEAQARLSLGRELAAMYVDPSAIRSSDATDDSADTGGTHDTGGTGETNETGGTNETGHTFETTDTVDTELAAIALGLPAGLYNVDEHGRLSATSPVSDGERPTSMPSRRPNNPTPPSAHSRLSAPDSLRPPPMPRPHRSASSFSDESFLEQRWLKGLSFGSSLVVFPPRAGVASNGKSAGAAQVLFWLGFIVPWCWLVGGWLLTRDGGVREEERGSLLPLWHRRRDRLRRGSAETAVTTEPGSSTVHGDADAAKEKGKGRLIEASDDAQHPMSMEVSAQDKVKGAAARRIMAKSWYPLFAPSLESLTPTRKSDEPSCRLQKCFTGGRAADPWVARCRIAAAVSGLLILVGFVVAMVFVAGALR